MDNKLYKQMNWPEIESIVYSECSNPEKVLGCHQVSGGYLIQAFFPGADSVSVHDLKTDKIYEMECVDEEGFYARLISVKGAFNYDYRVDYGGNLKTCPEVYKIIPEFWGDLSEKLDAGILYDSYRYFGAHFTERKGVLGTEFMTYAPGAERVSVVGDFNNWDGRVHQMCRIDERGVFALFIPGLSQGALYKFEIKLLSGLTFLKRDPFATALEKGEGDACLVYSGDVFEKGSYRRTALSDRFSVLSLGIDTLLLGERKPSDIASNIIAEASGKGFDLVLFPDLTRCDFKDVTDNGTVSFFAFNPNLPTVDELRDITSALHEHGLKVMGTVEPSRFIADDAGLRGYDGTRLFEGNEREIADRLNFDLSKPFVRNYLISVCDYQVNVLHLDGLCIGGMDRILYLDYGKFDGEWIPNIYGGNENLNGQEFVKHLNSILHKRYPKIVTVAKDSYVSNTLTLPLDEVGLGFDYKFHTQFDRDLVRYMERDVRGRSANHFELTYSPVYIYCERFILSLLNENYGGNAGKFAERFPFSEEDRLKNLRLITSYMYMHPGRKCLPFTGEMPDRFDTLLSFLNGFYKERNEFKDDDAESGFEWINAIDSEDSVIAFIRKKGKERLLVIANFSDRPVNFRMGIDEGAYKEVFASEQIRFGGEYKLSGRVKQTSKVRCDGREDSLSVKLAPFCLHIYEKTPCQTKA